MANRRSRRKKTGWTLETSQMVMGAFAKMLELYGQRLCNQYGLVIYQYQDGGIHSPEFMAWCSRCEGLTLHQFNHALALIEQSVLQQIQDGNSQRLPSSGKFVRLAKSAPRKPQQPAPSQKNGSQGPTVAGIKAIKTIRANLECEQ